MLNCVLLKCKICRVHVKAKVVCKTGVHNTAMGSASGPFYKILLADKTDQIYLFVYLHPRPPLGANRKFTEEMQEVVDLLEVRIYVHR